MSNGRWHIDDVHVSPDLFRDLVAGIGRPH
jgi:hypothetical protein